MRTIIEEYGLFVVAVIAGVLVFTVYKWFLPGIKNWSASYIRTITGADVDAEWE